MANDTLVGWVDSSPGRDTSTIISTCILTMFLCVFSALHLNIGPYKESFIHEWLHNALWMGAGLFGPELVVFCAFKQYESATALTRSIEAMKLGVQETKTARRAFSRDETGENALATIMSSEVKVVHPFTNVHGFYVAMGGFAFEIDDELEELLQTGIETRRLTITPFGVQLLAQCGVLPSISKRDIKDKSKSDSLGKFIVILQAAWFLMQVIARVVYHLPVTLLEINTIGHVVCAFMIYCLWWSKPKSCKEPTIIRGPWTRGMIAYMWMSSQISESTTNHNSIRYLFTKFRPVPEFARISFKSPTMDVSETSSTTASAEKGHEKAKPPPSTAVKESVLVRTQSQTPADQLPALNPQWQELDRNFVAADERTWRRWKAALHAVRTFPEIAERLNDTPLVKRTDSEIQNMNFTEKMETSRIRCDEDLCCYLASNWDYPGLMRNHHSPMGILLWFGSMVYGAVHAAAWNDYFPTRAERICWRTAAVDIVASGLVWVYVTSQRAVSARFSRLWDSVQNRKASIFLYLFLIVICSLCGLFFCLSRAYLVIESFVSLRRLPQGCYDTPDWTARIPHFGAGN